MPVEDSNKRIARELVRQFVSGSLNPPRVGGGVARGVEWAECNYLIPSGARRLKVTHGRSADFWRYIRASLLELSSVLKPHRTNVLVEIYREYRYDPGEVLEEVQDRIDDWRERYIS